jgi:hypothetical protein
MNTMALCEEQSKKKKKKEGKGCNSNRDNQQVF